MDNYLTKRLKKTFITSLQSLQRLWHPLSISMHRQTHLIYMYIYTYIAQHNTMYMCIYTYTCIYACVYSQAYKWLSCIEIGNKQFGRVWRPPENDGNQLLKYCHHSVVEYLHCQLNMHAHKNECRSHTRTLQLLPTNQHHPTSVTAINYYHLITTNHKGVLGFPIGSAIIMKITGKPMSGIHSLSISFLHSLNSALDSIKIINYAISSFDKFFPNSFN